MEIDIMPEVSSLFTTGGIKRNVMVRKNGVLKVTKLNSSLTSKIKTKMISNSSFLKTSLKHNNKALAMALSAEKENSQQLKSEKLSLQREVDELHLQKVLLHQKLSYLNKTLIKIQAFLHNNLLTAIEISTSSESVLKPITLDGAQCNTSGHPSKLSNQVRTTEQYVVNPHIVESNGKKQGNIFVREADTCMLAEETASEQLNIQLLDPKQMLKPSEISKVETEYATTAFSEERQSHMEHISNGNFLDKASYTKEHERQSKGYNSPFLIHGYITERKKQTCISNNHPILINSDTKRDRNSMLHFCSSKLCTNNEIGNQIVPNCVSHIELTSQHNIEPSYINKVEIIKGQKSEETIYDTDMELTASELGEIVIIKSRGKKAKEIKADKISGNLRKVKYSNTEKQIKKKYSNKPKKINEKVPRNIQATESPPKLPLKVELFQKTTSQEMKLRNINEQAVEVTSDSNKNDKQLYVEGLKCQQKTINVLQTEKKTKNIFETAEDLVIQNSEENLAFSTQAAVLESNNIGCLDVSDVIVTEENLPLTQSYSVTSKINKLNYCEMESNQKVRRNLKGFETKEYIHDCETKQGQRTNIKNSYNNEINWKCSVRTERSALDVPKLDQINEVSQSDKRKIFAKASRKMLIINPNSLNKKKIYAKQKLHAKKLDGKNIPYKTSENGERIFSAQNVTTSCSIKGTEGCIETLNEKDNSISKPSRKTYFICSHDQNSKENIPVPNNTSRHYQEENDSVSTEKVGITNKEPDNRKPATDSEDKPLQELTNTRINVYPKYKKVTEDDSVEPISRRRVTVCYKEPSIKSKLRREDEFTDKTFLNSPVFKVKNKRSFKSKSRLL